MNDLPYQHVPAKNLLLVSDRIATLDFRTGSTAEFPVTTVWRNAARTDVDTLRAYGWMQ